MEELINVNRIISYFACPSFPPSVAKSPVRCRYLTKALLYRPSGILVFRVDMSYSKAEWRNWLERLNGQFDFVPVGNASIAQSQVLIKLELTINPLRLNRMMFTHHRSSMSESSNIIGLELRIWRSTLLPEFLPPSCRRSTK